MTEDDSEGRERRRFGSPTIAALVIANMVGAGVFTTSGYALSDLRSPSSVMLAWAVGGVIALLGALCYGALAARMSESGGEYLFVSRTLHPFAGFLAGWVSLWAGFTSAIALAAEAAQAYLSPLIPAAMPRDAAGTTMIIAAGFMHSRGAEAGARAQTAVVVAKVLMLVVLICIGTARLPPQAPAQPAAMDLGAFSVTLMWVSLSYSGWNAGVYIAGEVRSPRRTLPRGLVAGTVVTTVLYLGLNWVFVHADSVDALANKPDIAAVAARALGGPLLEAVTRGVVVVGLVTSISSMVMIGPRVYAQMAADGLFPRSFAFTGQTPRRAIWLQVFLAVLILWASGLRAQLTNLGWILSVFTALSVVGLVRLRRREGADRVPIFGYPAVPAAFLIAVLFLVVSSLRSAATSLVPTAVVLGTGVIAYLALPCRASSRRGEEVRR